MVQDQVRVVKEVYLPLPASDFIFAIILEEYGLIGGVFALLLYLILLFRAIRISIKIDSVFGSLVSVGLIFSLVFQALNSYVSFNWADASYWTNTSTY